MAPGGLASGREVAESCLELLLAESCAHFSAPGAAQPAKSALESLGFQVGLQLVERYARDKPRFSDNLDVIKFLCKEFWSEVFKKQVDNLKTNYRGVYVLTDTRFRWLARFAGAAGPAHAEAVQRALHVPCGILAGALAGLGVAAVVTAEATQPPSCAFTVRIKTPPAPVATPPPASAT